MEDKKEHGQMETNSSVNRFSIGQEYDGTGSSATDFFDGKMMRSPSGM